MTGQVNKFGKTLMKLAGVIGAAFGTVAIINFGKDAIKAASDLSDAWMGLQSIVEGQGKSFNKAQSFINDYISDGLVPLENAVTAYKNLAARGYGTEQIEKTMIALKDAAAFGRQASYSLGEAVSSATEGLKNENSILVDNAGVTKNVAKMWDDYARSIGTTANNLTQEQKIQAEVNGIIEETRFQTGDAAKLVNTYSGQIALLGFNFQQLKVQVGNALMPIARAVLPGINAIISALQDWASDVWDTITGAFSTDKAKSSVKTGANSSALRASSYRMVPAALETYTASYNLPKLANGAVIPPNQQFAAILGDQRSGVNIEAPLATIKQAVTEAMQSVSNIGNSGNITVVMEIDGREFGRASYKYGTAEQQRVGVRLTGVRT